MGNAPGGGVRPMGQPPMGGIPPGQVRPPGGVPPSTGSLFGNSAGDPLKK